MATRGTNPASSNSNGLAGEIHFDTDTRQVTALGARRDILFRCLHACHGLSGQR